MRSSCAGSLNTAACVWMRSAPSPFESFHCDDDAVPSTETKTVAIPSPATGLGGGGGATGCADAAAGGVALSEVVVVAGGAAAGTGTAGCGCAADELMKPLTSTVATATRSPGWSSHVPGGGEDGRLHFVARAAQLEVAEHNVERTVVGAFGRAGLGDDGNRIETHRPFRHRRVLRGGRRGLVTTHQQPGRKSQQDSKGNEPANDERAIHESNPLGVESGQVFARRTISQRFWRANLSSVIWNRVAIAYSETARWVSRLFRA